MATQLPSPKAAQPPIFGPYLLWPKAGWIMMPLGMEVGLGPGNFMSDVDPAPPPQFLAHVYCGKTAGWIKMPLGIELDLGRGNFVRW